MAAARLKSAPEVCPQIQYEFDRHGPRRRRNDPTRDVEDSNRWAVILAGGDGTRLLPFTRTITGEDTPKQFCAVTGNETLLAQTQRRISTVVPRQRTLVVVTQAHERYYASQLDSTSNSNLLVQPSNRGTAPAIVYSLTCLRKVAPRGVVGFFPSDHHFDSEGKFATVIEQAYKYAEIYGQRVFLLGIAPQSAEVDYGWIEPGVALLSRGGCEAFEVCRFWEKPSRRKARDLIHAGGLWNSFIMVGRLTAFLDMIRSSRPALLKSFDDMWDGIGLDAGTVQLSELYAKIPVSNFSREVLVECPRSLAVLCAQGLGWTDLGVPERLLRTIESNTKLKTRIPLAIDI